MIIYILSVVQNGLATQSLYRGSLEKIDKITTGFNKKKDFIIWINQSYNFNFNCSKAEVKITYNLNKSIRPVNVIYAKDKKAINIELTKERLLSHCDNKDFVIKFIERYYNNKSLLKLAGEVAKKIKMQKEYMPLLRSLINILFEGYKAPRDIYFFLEKYEATINKKKEHDTCLIDVPYDRTSIFEMLQSSSLRQLTISDWAKQLNCEDQVFGGLAKVKNKKNI
jgi:hypothetical protein